MRRWYAVQSKPRQERVALANLLRQHYAAYLPHCTQRKLTRGRHHSLTAPLFPGYLFVELNLGQDNTAPIRSTIGCTGLVRFGTRMPALPAGFIERLRELEQREGALRIAEPEWAPGQDVSVTEGPFAGLNAVFKTRSGAERVIVLLEWLGAQRPVELPEQVLAVAAA
jgi:transcriptional antiterminator RfaH